MRSIFVFLTFIAAGFAAGFMAAKGNVMELISSRIKTSNKTLSTRFQPTEYALDNQFFCIVIIGRNNGAYLEKTIQSAISQKYENFRVVYVDDGSDDGSQDLAKEKLLDAKIPTIVICNPEKLGINGSLSLALQDCKEDEIVVLLHGEDWLAHDWVIKRLNQYYADPDLWAAFGRSRDYPSYGLSSNHLLSFYANLFDGKLEALKDKTLDHFEQIPDILYVSQTY